MRNQASRSEPGTQPVAYKLLLALSLAFSLAAVLTLVPNPDASWPNILGYKSICPFAPAATALCGLLAGATCVIRSRLVSARAAQNRYRPPFVPIAVAVVLLGIAVPSAIIWSGYKQLDATGGASRNAAPAQP